MKRRGFTLIELLVVISIISLLSSIVLATLGESREKAKIARAQQELLHIRNVIGIMTNDLGKLPCGCPVGENSDPSISLNDANAGLRSQAPKAYIFGDSTTYCAGQGSPPPNPPPCHWTAADVAKWNMATSNGSRPYVTFDLIDPWGRPYYFDPDYVPFANKFTTQANAPGCPGGVSPTCNQWGCPNAPVDVASLTPGQGWPSGWKKSVVFSFGPPAYPQFQTSYATSCFTLGNCYTCREVFVENR